MCLPSTTSLCSISMSRYAGLTQHLLCIHIHWTTKQCPIQHSNSCIHFNCLLKNAHYRAKVTSVMLYKLYPPAFCCSLPRLPLSPPFLFQTLSFSPLSISRSYSHLKEENRARKNKHGNARTRGGENTKH